MKRPQNSLNSTATGVVSAETAPWVGMYPQKAQEGFKREKERLWDLIGKRRSEQ